MPFADHSSPKIVTARKDAARMEIVRAGANYPNAVPSTYRENPSHPAALYSQSTPRKQYVTRTCTVLTSRRNSRPMPAFGATRDEGAVGPIAGLSIYADAARLQCRRRPTKPPSSIPRPPRPEPLQTMAKGPTADTIISMIAAGKKPPVPEEWQINEHKKWLSKISASMATAVSAHRQNLQNNSIKKLAFESSPLEVGRNSMILPDEIPEHYQTWSEAFSEDGGFIRLSHPLGPGGARYPENYPPGIMESLNESTYDHSGLETETTSFLRFKITPMVDAGIQSDSMPLKRISLPDLSYFRVYFDVSTTPFMR
ncbi:uncharacterized protein [Neodiprion pinetum]|uniref:uncharacterized protein n=1 Tax=Neodiprion pinetum TaxID=441929 RepID=UPI0037133883